MHATALRALAALRRRAAVFVVGAALLSSGCALIPTWDDVHSATATVKDTVTGKARRDHENKTYAEARILERRRDFATAERMYRELLVKNPQSRDCYHRLAVMASVQNKFDEANSLYQSALACGNPTADLWSDIGYCYYLQQQLPHADQALRQALAIEPQHRAALNNLALTVGESGNLDEAYRLFRQGNKESEAEANFAYLCAQCGDLQRAQHHYSRALSFDPEMRVAAQAMLQVTQRMQMAQQDAAFTAAKAAINPTVGNGAQQVGYQEGQVAYDRSNAPQRPLIEVFAAGGPRSAVPHDARAPVVTAGHVEQTAGPGAVGNLTAAQAAGPIAAPASRADAPQPTPTGAGFVHSGPTNPTAFPGLPQPQSYGQIPGSTTAAPQPYSFAQPAQPQYLQPSASSHDSSMSRDGSGMSIGNQSPSPQPAPYGGALSAPAGNAFPPLNMGHPSMLR